MFRGDYITFIGGFVIYMIIAVFTLGFGGFFVGFVWAFLYNKYYTSKLLERGYVLAGSEADNAVAAAKLGLVLPAATPSTNV